jgi:hypothetical protein
MKRYILATLSMVAMPLVASAQSGYGSDVEKKDPTTQGQMGHESMGADNQNKHIIMGEVTTLDKQSNEVTIRTQDGEELQLSFPASQLTNIKQGDRVAVEVSLRPVTPGMEQGSQGSQGSQQNTPGTQRRTPGTTTPSTPQ